MQLRIVSQKSNFCPSVFTKKLKLTLLCHLFHQQIELMQKFKTKLNQTLKSARASAAFLRSTLLCRRYASQALLSPCQASQALLSPGAALPSPR